MAAAGCSPCWFLADSNWQFTCALPYEPSEDLQLWVYDAAAVDEAQTVGRAVLHIGQVGGSTTATPIMLCHVGMHNGTVR